MTHEECIGQIVQAVYASNAGNSQELHRLASLLQVQEEHAEDEPSSEFSEIADALAASQQLERETPEPYTLPRGFAEPLPGEQGTEGDERQ